MRRIASRRCSGGVAMRDDSVAEIPSASGGRPVSGRVTRRVALAFVLSTASAALLSACGANTPAAPQVSTPTSAPKPAGSAPTQAPAPPTQAVVQPTAPPNSAPRAGGTLTAAIQTDLPNVDAHFNSPAVYDALL